MSISLVLNFHLTRWLPGLTLSNRVMTNNKNMFNIILKFWWKKHMNNIWTWRQGAKTTIIQYDKNTNILDISQWNHWSTFKKKKRTWRFISFHFVSVLECMRVWCTLGHLHLKRLEFMCTMTTTGRHLRPTQSHWKHDSNTDDTAH